MKLKDLSNKKFGRLTAIRRHNRKWICQCDCGRLSEVLQYNLHSGHTKSCGCLKLESKSITHGKRNSKVYRVWSSMKTRCVNKSCRSFPNYGGRGIVMDERWESFENFLCDMGEPQDGFELDRINNNGPYSKSNCRWADKKTQANNRRSNRLLKLGDNERTISQWSDEIGFSSSTIRERLQRGWSVEKTLNTPVRKQRRK